MKNCSAIYILDQNQVSGEVLKNYLEELNLDCSIIFFKDYNLGLQEIKEQEKPPIVFIDIYEINETSKDLLEAIKLYTSKIVITSVDYSTNTIIKAMRLGAREFLPKPVLKEDLKKVVTLFSQDMSNIENSASKIITVYSNKGGIGKTTIATNLAVELANVTKDKVALIDLNLQLGDISTFLNLNPTFDVAYVIKNLVNKKDETLLNAFEKYDNTKLYILSDPNYIEQAESINPYQIEELFSALKKIFPYIIIDLSSNIDSNTLKILDKSDLVLFTTIVNIPAIRNAQRCLNLFRSRRYPKDKIKIILNRFMENEEISVADIETTLDEKIYWKFPNNYFSIMESINKGVPVSNINPNSNIANSFRDFASKISDDIVKQTILKYRGM